MEGWFSLLEEGLGNVRVEAKVYCTVARWWHMFFNMCDVHRINVNMCMHMCICTYINKYIHCLLLNPVA